MSPFQLEILAHSERSQNLQCTTYFTFHVQYTTYFTFNVQYFLSSSLLISLSCSLLANTCQPMPPSIISRSHLTPSFQIRLPRTHEFHIVHGIASTNEDSFAASRVTAAPYHVHNGSFPTFCMSRRLLRRLYRISLRRLPSRMQ